MVEEPSRIKLRVPSCQFFAVSETRHPRTFSRTLGCADDTCLALGGRQAVVNDQALANVFQVPPSALTEPLTRTW
jgi:hypothetical protein